LGLTFPERSILNLLLVVFEVVRRYIKVQKLDRFVSVSNSELTQVVGGDNADYNMGYETGRDMRRTVNHIVRWWNQHFFTRREMN